MADESLYSIAALVILVGLPGLVLLIRIVRGFFVVGKKTAVVIERWGKFHKKVEEGLHFLWPWMDRVRTLKWRVQEAYTDPNGYESYNVEQSNVVFIDLREAAYDFPSQTIITRDNVEIKVHPLLLYKIIDPVRAVYEVYDLCHALEKLVQTTLRSIIGDMGLDDTLASREEINRALQQKLSHVCHNWGVEITGVEVLEIIPSPSIQAAMHEQIAAERIRRANIVTALGHQLQMKTLAEGDCQAVIALSKAYQQTTILRARGRAEARKCLAAAEAKALNILQEALAPYGSNAGEYSVALKYLDSFNNVVSSANRREIYLPYQTDIRGTAHAIGER